MKMLPVIAPKIEPVSRAEIKTLLRIDNIAEDQLIAALITTARVHVENITGCRLMEQSWTVKAIPPPFRRSIRLDLHPITAISKVRLYEGNTLLKKLNSQQYMAELLSRPASLRLTRPVRDILQGERGHENAKVDCISVEVTCGYGKKAENVPAPLRQAVQMLAAHWYEYREMIAFGVSHIRHPANFQSLVTPYRLIRL